MRFHKFDLNSLVCLDALLTEKSITRAADRLFLSRPAMSNALARLREHFKDELLAQVGKTMIPTSFALSIQGPVRELLLQTQVIISASPVNVDMANVKRKISIICSDYIESIFLPDVLARIYGYAPGICIDIRPLSFQSVEDINSGEADFLIASDAIIVDSHPSETLFKDTFSCIFWECNDRIGDVLTFEQYLSLGHVVAQWSVGRFKALDEQFLHSQHLTRNVEVWVSTFTQMPQYIVGTRRVGTLPTRLAHWAARLWPLRVFGFPAPITPLVEKVQWHRYQQSDLVMFWLRQQFRQVGSMLLAAS